MSLRVLRIELRRIEMRTRMPFKYGIATLTALPHLFIIADVEIDGRVQRGIAAEHLPPKWFTKDPASPIEQDIAGMIEVIRSACAIAESIGGQSCVFDLWRSIYAEQKHWAAATSHPPLLWGFGVSLIERAVIDAFCRAKQTSFEAVLRSNALGIRLGDLHPELDGATPADFVPAEPLRTLIVRHTVGLSDPLTDADIAPGDRIADGLPQSLEESVRSYGLTHFKIKLSGDIPRDVQRLRDIAKVLGNDSQIRFTLDGNENFRDPAAVREMWGQLATEPFMRRMIALEQPLHRDLALSDDTARAFAQWVDRPPMIIDESDGEIDSAPRALEVGYRGTSYKSCKGVIKGISAACLMANRGGIVTAEDLSTVGPTGLPQDLAVVASLGITHVERNGHHYFRGLSAFDEATQARALHVHPDLYRRMQGMTALRIENGAIRVESVIAAPFGTTVMVEAERLPLM